jgi:hypothetical protein
MSLGLSRRDGKEAGSARKDVTTTRENVLASHGTFPGGVDNYPERLGGRCRSAVRRGEINSQPVRED